MAREMADKEHNLLDKLVRSALLPTASAGMASATSRT
jgi:hypothetical protein